MVTKAKEKKENNIKKVISITSKVISLLVLSFLVFYFVFDKVNPNLTAKKLGFKSYSIITESMEPVINKGDFIFVFKQNFDTLKEGDIVTFVDYNKNVVTHNFAKYQYAQFTHEDGSTYQKKAIRTKPESDSDGNLTDQLDFWIITEENFIGKYGFKISKVGAVVDFLKSWFGLAIIFFGAGFIITIVYIIKILKTKK